MVQSSHATRVRYPVQAILAVAGAGLLFLFDMVVGFIFMALVPPFIPVYVGVLFGGVCLLGTALRYAERVSVRVPAAMLQLGKHDEEVRDRAATARAA